MQARRRRIACLLAAGLLALPATAAGQSAGDDQYQDPFAGEQESPEEQEPEAQEPEAAPAPSSSSAQEPAPVAPAQAPDGGGSELPRTGADEGLVALAGVVMLAGGVALRLRVR